MWPQCKRNRPRSPGGVRRDKPMPRMAEQAHSHVVAFSFERHDVTVSSARARAIEQPRQPEPPHLEHEPRRRPGGPVLMIEAVLRPHPTSGVLGLHGRLVRVSILPPCLGERPECGLCGRQRGRDVFLVWRSYMALFPNVL
jgi:hypothetical protein